MKILVVAERESLQAQINLHFRPHGSEIIHYWSPIKAMDNIDEINPDLILFSAQDFPRHWKTFLSFLRNSRSREESVFILLKGDDFPFEEAAKAQALGANGIVHENIGEKRELNRLKRLVERYKSLHEGRRSKRFLPDELDRISFVFTRPDNLSIVCGDVVDISADGLSFHAHNDEHIEDLDQETLLSSCSLRIGETILNVDCKVLRMEHYLHLIFVDLAEECRQTIIEYLEAHTIREIEREKKAGTLSET